MATSRILIPSLLIGGYRSFGRRVQRFKRFAKINLLIGPNNSGKSNVLRFIQTLYPNIGARPSFQLTALDNHFPGGGDFRYGRQVSLAVDAQQKYQDLEPFVRQKVRGNQPAHVIGQCVDAVGRAFKQKAKLDGVDDAWFEFQRGGQLAYENWEAAFGVLDDRTLQVLWRILTGSSGGGRTAWYQGALGALTPTVESTSVEIVPAIREVRAGAASTGFSGAGLIERLAKLQNPDFSNQQDKNKFEAICSFLQSVTDNRSARIEIPYERNTIVVHMDGKALPLESLGTGIHEVIILAAAATVLDNTVVCMEEPELHLNPVLQRKLVRYLSDATNNQYFITTHSAALMDTPEAEIYHVHLDNGESIVERVTSDRHRSAVCEDLGYRPSDLLQANCVIWVEGPSDRVYLLHWLSKRAPELQEGIHFSIMFCGGRLEAHISGNDLDEVIGEFISLRRLNRRAVIVIDSDKSAIETQLNATKMRLIEEFNRGPGHAWVTEGREIENHLSPDAVRAAIATVLPRAAATSTMGQYEHVLAITSATGKSAQAPKVEIAKHIRDTGQFEENRLDLKVQLDKLIAFIRESNPAYEAVQA